MLRELKTAALTVIVLTVALGLAYPLVMTGSEPGRVPGPGRRLDGRARREARRLAADRPGLLQGPGLLPEPAVGDRTTRPRRPSSTTRVPNQQDLADQLKGFVADYLERERPYTPGLTAARVPSDAATTSASGVDPHISEANARIQANRVAARRGLDRARVLELVDEHASRPLFGLGGEQSINVLELNLALDREASR